MFVQGSFCASRPSWDRLYAVAANQAGYFTSQDAMEAGYSPQLLGHHMKHGRIRRARRGLYRLAHFPPCDHEHLVIYWLWSGREGIYSHETALTLHELSDVLPARVHMTLPSVWQNRRLRIPNGLVIHYASISSSERTWVDCLPVTAVLRTLRDCLDDQVSLEWIYQAVAQALRRGLVDPDQLPIEVL